MKKDPFMLEAPKDPFEGKRKIAEVVVSMYEGAPPNLGVRFEPPTMSPLKMMGLLLDTVTMFYKMSVSEANRLKQSGIEIVKTTNDAALRNGN